MLHLNFFVTFAEVGKTVDIVFAVDKEMNSHALTKASNLISAAVRQYSIQATDTRVGLVQYGANAEILYSLQTANQDALNGKLAGLVHANEQRRIPESLRQINRNIFAKSVRAGAKKTIIMFVNGPSDDVNPQEVTAVSQELGRNNINVLFVYIGDHSDGMLHPLTKGRYDIMHLPSYKDMAFAIDLVLRLQGLRPGEFPDFFSCLIVRYFSCCFNL